MFKIGKLNLILLLSCIFIFMTVSCVSASDNGTVDVYGLNANSDGDIDGAFDNVCGDVIVEDDVVDCLRFGVADNGTFDDLYNDILNLNPGDTYNINKDYYYDELDLVSAKYGIIINVDNVLINGNGHVIDGKNKSVLFSVYGKNVKIFNLTCINSYFDNPKVTNYDKYSVQKGRSPINWEGDYGEISDCTFSGNSALTMGGAISWNGNDGIIRNTVFINNTAGVIGGAIYLSNSNNVVDNCVFINSSSKIGGEMIYVDRNHKDCDIFAAYNGKMLVMDGGITNIDVDYFNYIYETFFCGKKLNIIPLIYSAMISKEEYVRLNEDTIYYAQLLANDFIFTLVKDFGDGFTYERNFHLLDVEDLNDVFKLMIQEKYEDDVICYKDITVKNTEDYERACTFDRNSAIALNEYILISMDFSDKSDDIFDDIMWVLNVDFENAMTINSKKTWNPEKRGFDTININGHGSTIKISSGDRDEEKWAKLTAGYTLGVSDLTVSGFNTAIENLGGTCILRSVWLENNRMDYWIDRDWGAAILNGGICVCTDCSFINNYCSNGGAIFNQGNLTLIDCYFSDNKAYRHGDNILNVDEGVVTIDGEVIKGSSGYVKYVKSIDDVTSFFVHVVSYGLSFVIGVMVGALTANPVIGTIAGAGVGALIGTIASVYLIKNTYDINYSRLKTCLLLIGGCALSGALGGYLGAGIETVAAANVVEEDVPVVNNVLNDLMDASSSSISEITESVGDLSLDSISVASAHF